MKFPIWMSLSKIKQGIKQNKPTEILKDDEEYETYIDERCGCKKRRIIKRKKNETNESISENRNG